MKVLFVAILLLYCNIMSAQNILLLGNLYDINHKQIKTGYLVDVYEAGTKIYSKNHLPGQDPTDTIALFSASSRKTNLLFVEISAQGYEKATRNIFPKWDNAGAFSKKIEITFKPSDLPVLYIQSSNDQKKKCYTFIGEFHNRSKKVFAIRHVIITSEQKIHATGGCLDATDSTNIFIIKDTMRVTNNQVNRKDTLYIHGNYNQKSDPEQLIEIEGVIGFNDCEHVSYFKLDLHCLFSILPEELLKKIKISLPFSFTGKQPLGAELKIEKYKRDFQATPLLKLADFKNVTFKFITADSNDLPIEAYCDLPSVFE